MTRIAILADIHGNLPALEAVLDDVARRSPDELVHAGDLIGRGPEGTAVVRRMLDAGIPGVRGNHEDFVLDVRANGDAAFNGGSNVEMMALPGVRWMADELDDAAAQAVNRLPFTRTADGDPTVHVVHGSPRSNREGIGPWTDTETLATMLVDFEGDVLACAHTHRPLVRESGGVLVVNVGSVGLPFDGDARASYAIVERRHGRWTADIRRVDYDRDAVLERYESTGFLDAAGTMARALTHEIRSGFSYLVPFLTWAELEGREADDHALDDFTDYYDPRWGVRELRRRSGAATAG